MRTPGYEKPCSFGSELGQSGTTPVRWFCRDDTCGLGSSRGLTRTSGERLPVAFKGLSAS
ncbi:hypothetical protein PybrP1_009686 [[Pythium] brassicae (nom. inval.)]|nr:hypothetical protein PybrP1_009686 [[Pythium] brassicae (nom. inval.)]